MSERRGASRPLAEPLPRSIEVAVQAIDDLKATDMLVLDLRQVASFTDYMVICTGSSDRHVQAVVDGVRERLRAIDVTPLHTEGYRQAAWVLVDFVDFLVNVFTPEARAFYQLERVWRDAPVRAGERPDAPPAKGRREEGPPAGDGEHPDDGGGAADDAADG